MIVRKIIDTFYDLARQHKLIRSFVYDRVSKGMGTGEKNYPQFFLEDPIYINDTTPTTGQTLATVSFDITCLPQAFSNFNVRQLTEDECQNVCHQIALHIIAKLRSKNLEYETRIGMEVVKYSFMTLRNWGDDKAAGIRCTVQLALDNDIQLCDLDEHFDSEKVFDLGNLLNDINTDNAHDCHGDFSYKLPQIKID